MSEQESGRLRVQDEALVKPVIARLRELLEKATPAPWIYRPHRHDDWGCLRAVNDWPVAMVRGGREMLEAEFDKCRVDKTDPFEGNALFIAAARNELPALLDWIEKMLPTVEMGAALHSDATSLSSTDRERKLDHDLTQTLEERDSAEDALGRAYMLVTGNDPEWSNHFGYAEALDAIEEAGAATADRERKYREALFDAIAHGDAEHRAWLKEAIDCHFSGKPVPPPRSALPTEQDK